MTDWWTKSSADQFEVRAQCLKDQYSQYVIEGLHVNGAQTINENIADNSGIKSKSHLSVSFSFSSAAFSAWKLYDKKHGKNERILEEFTNEQMFFIAYGQSWCSKFRPEAAKLRILTDTHSPPSVRVTAPLVNFDVFAKTFDCPVGSRMNPEKKCKLW